MDISLTKAHELINELTKKTLLTLADGGNIDRIIREIHNEWDYLCRKTESCADNEWEAIEARMVFILNMARRAQKAAA